MTDETPTLREGVRHARELGGAKSAGPVAVSRDVEELKLDVDLGLADQVALLVQDLEPAVHLFAVDDVGDGQISPPDERRAYGLVQIDSEDDVGHLVSAVDVEGLSPSRVIRSLRKQPRPAHSDLVQVHGGVDGSGAPAQAYYLNELHEKREDKKTVLFVSVQLSSIDRLQRLPALTLRKKAPPLTASDESGSEVASKIVACSVPWSSL